MIKVKKETVKLQGDFMTLMTEFSIATKGMINMMGEQGIDREKAIELLDKAYETGKLTREEAMVKIAEILVKMVEEER